MSDHVYAPDHVIACDVGPATVVIDYSTGRVHTLTGTAAAWWAEAARVGDVARCTTMPVATGAALAARLVAIGLLRTTDRPRPSRVPVPGHPWRPSWGTQELDYGFPDLPPVSMGNRVLAPMALAVTLAVRDRMPRAAAMPRLIHLVRCVQNRATGPADLREAEDAVHAVRRIGVVVPARVACLEQSVAAVLVLAARRRGVTWCHGVAGDPIELHAWLANREGTAIAEPVSTGRFRALLAIPSKKEYARP